MSNCHDVNNKFMELTETEFVSMIDVIDNPVTFAALIRTLSWNMINNGNIHQYLHDRGALKLEFGSVTMEEADLRTKEIEFSFYNSKSVTGYDSELLCDLVAGMIESLGYETVLTDVYYGVSDVREREEIVIRVAKLV
jgi:hypothetical protein